MKIFAHTTLIKQDSWKKLMDKTYKKPTYHKLFQYSSVFFFNREITKFIQGLSNKTVMIRLFGYNV